MKVYLGIDFGASNIMVSYAKDNDRELRQIRFNNPSDNERNWTMPNWYALSPDGEEYLGWEAKNRYEKVIEDGEETDLQFFHSYKTLIREPDSEKAHAMGFSETFSPLDLFEKMFIFILAHAKKYIEEVHEEKPAWQNITVTVPVGWEEGIAREQYRKVLDKVCPDVRYRLVGEPVAASVPLINRVNYDGKVLNCLVVDIGASTLDVSISSYSGEPPLLIEKGGHNQYAGNYCDEKIAKWLLEKNPKGSTEEAQQDAIAIKHLGEKRRPLKRLLVGWGADGIIQKVKDIFKLDQVRSIAQKMAKEAVGTIGNVLDNRADLKIDYLIFCGGMSQFQYGFIDAIIDMLQQKYPAQFENCQIDSDIGDKTELRQFAIANGAALLAKDPLLVIEPLGYEIGMTIEIAKELNGKMTEEEKYLPIIPAQQPIREGSIISLREAIENNRHELGLLKSAIPKLRVEDVDTLPICLRQPKNKTVHRYGVNVEQNWAKIHKLGTMNVVDIKDGMSCDIHFALDDAGILELRLIEAESQGILAIGTIDVLKRKPEFIIG